MHPCRTNIVSPARQARRAHELWCSANCRHPPSVNAYSLIRSENNPMPSKRRNAPKSLAAKSAELAFAVPQVVAHRVARMALAGSSPSDGDRREFNKMISEKQAAFSQAWIAMATETFRANQSIAASLFGSFLSPRATTKTSTASISRKMQRAANSIASKGLAPIHRTAVANSKRLAKLKSR